MTNAKRHNRGTNWKKITDYKLSEILNSHHTIGVDGVDYAPYLEELLSEHYRRLEARSLEALKQFEQDQKIYTKHLNAKRLA